MACGSELARSPLSRAAQAHPEILGVSVLLHLETRNAPVWWLQLAMLWESFGCSGMFSDAWIIQKEKHVCMLDFSL